MSDNVVRVLFLLACRWGEYGLSGLWKDIDEVC